MLCDSDSWRGVAMLCGSDSRTSLALTLGLTFTFSFTLTLSRTLRLVCLFLRLSSAKLQQLGGAERPRCLRL